MARGRRPGVLRRSLLRSQTVLSAVGRTAHACSQTLCLQCDAMQVVVDVGVGVGMKGVTAA